MPVTRSRGRARGGKSDKGAGGESVEEKREQPVQEQLQEGQEHQEQARPWVRRSTRRRQRLPSDDESDLEDGAAATSSGHSQNPSTSLRTPPRAAKAKARAMVQQQAKQQREDEEEDDEDGMDVQLAHSARPSPRGARMQAARARATATTASAQKQKDGSNSNSSRSSDDDADDVDDEVWRPPSKSSSNSDSDFELPHSQVMVRSPQASQSQEPESTPRTRHARRQRTGAAATTAISPRKRAKRGGAQARSATSLTAAVPASAGTAEAPSSSQESSSSSTSSTTSSSSPPASTTTPRQRRSRARGRARGRGRGRASARGRARAKPKKKKETVEERIKRLHPEVEGVWDTLKGIDPSQELDPALQPEELTVALLPFQREGLAWMAHQEANTEFQGGILADEMGMGKTIQTIALMTSRPSTASKPTLVIAPTVALFQWRTEIEAKTKPGSLSVLVYYGGNRKRDPKHIRGFDVVLTTYATVESEWRRQQSGFQRRGVKMKEPSTLHAVEWHRAVLDEAHFIKDRSSGTARAVFGLSAQFKWSLSGTPLQNRVGEMYSLVKFLKAEPFSYYFCKQCDCKMLNWRFSNYKSCDHCGHANCSHFGWWNREILRPIQNFGPVGKGKIAFDRLRQLLGSIMLRRTKIDRGSELGLPPRIIHTRRDLFTHEEEDFYEALFSESKTRFQSFVRTGTVLNNYAHIFELLMRMRQSVNHPWLVTHRVDSKDDKDVCGICHEFAEDAIMSGCKHVFCREEIQLYLSSSCADEPVCPVCFQPLSIDLTQPTLDRPKVTEKRKKTSIVRRLDMERWQSSTKIEALLEELTALQSDTHCIKSIIFSQFTQFLDLLEWRLQRGGIRCVKLDGRMSPANRAAVIDAFNTKPEITVFLISLKAGGLALNLTAASRVYITDPWWNPCAEAQAMDRIHRLGQYRPVEVRRLIIENSIESRIDQLQEKKQLLFESTVGMNSSALNRLTEEDLRFLFVL